MHEIRKIMEGVELGPDDQLEASLDDQENEPDGIEITTNARGQDSSDKTNRGH